MARTSSTKGWGSNAKRLRGMGGRRLRLHLLDAREAISDISKKSGPKFEGSLVGARLVGSNRTSQRPLFN